MKNIRTLLSLLIMINLSSISKVEASHVAGADLTYTYVSQNVIHLKLRYYRDCTGIPASPTGNVRISSASCTVSAFTVNMPLYSATEIVTSDCIDTTILTTCHPGGTRYGVEEYIFEQDVTLPMMCNDWLFEFEECCRNASQTMTGNPSLYINTNYNNVTAPINHSPQFLSYPVVSFCLGIPFCYQQNAIDPDGDSLVYSLVKALGAGSSTVNYISPYSGIYPIASSSGVIIDQTGQICLTPSVIQIAVVCVLVEEYRNGIKIGSVRRDMQVKIEANCNPFVVPQYNQQALVSGIEVPCGSFEFDIPFNMQLQCSSIVNDDFRAINSMGFPIPIVSITPLSCIGGLTDSVHVVMSEPFTHGSNFVFSKTGADGNTILGQCGFTIPVFDTIKYTVHDSSAWQASTDSVGCFLNSFTTILSDYIYCFTVDQDASSFTLMDAGNGNIVLPITSAYTFCGPSGDSLSNQLLINFSTNQTLTGPIYLIVKTGNDNNTVANSCGRFLNAGDTIAVFYINNAFTLSLGQDIEACANNNEIPVALNSGYANGGGISFQWYLNGSLINGATNHTYSAVNSGIYSLIAYTSSVCKGADTVNVNVININDFDLGSDRDICAGESVYLSMGSGGMINQWYLNGMASDLDTLPVYGVTSTAQYVGAAISYSPNGHFCYSIDTVNITAWPLPVHFLSDQTLCYGMLPFTIDAGNSGASFLWFAEELDTLQTYLAYGAGTYVVTITNFPGCTLQDSMTLTLENQLAAPILDCGTVSGGAYSTIYSWSSVAGNAGYEVSFDSVNWVPANAPISPASHGTNIFSPTFYARALNTGKCSYGLTSPPFDCIVIVPNIITPNGDGQNDLFVIPNIALYPENKFRLYNRWGIRVFSADGYNNTTKVFKGEGLPADRYFYVLDFGNGPDRVTGTLTITE